jgi:hypothetical protein
MSVVVKVRVPGADVERWNAAAESVGLSLSEWLRRAGNEASRGGVTNRSTEQIGERRKRAKKLKTQEGDFAVDKSTRKADAGPIFGEYS